MVYLAVFLATLTNILKITAFLCQGGQAVKRLRRRVAGGIVLFFAAGCLLPLPDLCPVCPGFGVFGGQSAILAGLSTEMGCFGG